MPTKPSTLNPLPSPKGFTLIEILVVMVITAFLLLAGAANMLRIREKQTLISPSQQLVSAIQYVQNLSITAKESRMYGLEFSPDHYSIISRLNNDDSTFTIIKSYPLPKSLHLSVPASAHHLWFQKLTGIPDSAVTITLTSPHYQLTLDINTLGQVSTTQPKPI